MPRKPRGRRPVGLLPITRRSLLDKLSHRSLSDLACLFSVTLSMGLENACTLILRN